MKQLKYASGKKERFNVNLDQGIVKKSRALLSKYNESFSRHIDQLLDQWCQDQEESNKVHQIVNETIADLKKAGSTMPEKEAIKMLLEVSEERKKEMFNDQKIRDRIKEMEANSPKPTKEEREHARKVLQKWKAKLQGGEKK